MTTDGGKAPMTTSAPSRAKRNAIARPIPELEPVTNAVLPCIRSLMVASLSAAELLREGGFVEDLPMFNDELVFDAK